MIRTLQRQHVAPDLLPEHWERDARALLEALPDKYDEVHIQPSFDSDSSMDPIPPTEYVGTALSVILDGRYVAFLVDEPSTLSAHVDMYLKKTDYAFWHPFCKPCNKRMTALKPEYIEQEGKWSTKRTYQCPECKAEEQREAEAA